MSARRSLPDFLDRNAHVIRVVLTSLRGSSPREAGAEMFVSRHGMLGTIGGGQLEYMAIDHARNLLRQGIVSDRINIPLGPEIGQCCGGHVTLDLSLMTSGDRETAVANDTFAIGQQPQVLILGAGHVGRALARALDPLPLRAILIDSRAAELALSYADSEFRHTPLPEIEIRNAPAGSAFVVLTHDHALDFLLTSEALTRGDAAYVGMIGSATKRASFRSWCRTQMPNLNTAALICPIGAQGSADKRPEVIAAFVAAEVTAALTSDSASITKNKYQGERAN